MSGAAAYDAVVNPLDEVPPARDGRARLGRPAAVGVLVLATVLSLVAGGAVGRATRTPPSGPVVAVTAGPTSSPALRSTPDADEQRALAVTELLQTRAAAILAGDQAAWLSTVDPGSAFHDQQARVFENLRDVPFGHVSFELAGVAPALTPARQSALGESAWVARVVADVRIKDFDRTPTQSEQFLTAVRRGDRWYLAADTDGQTAVQPWDLGRVHVVRGDRVLALGTADTEALRGYAAAGDRAVARVSRVWGTSWPQRAVLLVPRTEGEMSRLLARTDGIDQIAAVTTGELGDDGSAGSDRVVINPSAFARLGQVGQRVVLTHEMTHVAVRSSTSAPVPIWLSEGFADYVGYQGVGLTRRTVAADLLALQRQGEGFNQLPTDTDFDPAATTIAPSYSASWLACSLLADQYGRAKLVRFYRTAATDNSSDPDTAVVQAFRSVFDTTQGDFTKTWVRYMTRLSG